MTISPSTRLRPLLRIGSALLVACAFVAVFRLIQQVNIPFWGWVVVGAILIPWCALFGYAAIAGRAPRWFAHTQPKSSSPDATL